VSNLNSTIQARISSFLDELNRLLRDAALEAVTSALGASKPKAAAAAAKRPAAKRAATPAKAAAPAKASKAAKPKAAKAAAPAAARKASRGKGEKRSPATIKRTTDALAAYVKSNSGKRIEEISKAMGVSTKDLALPIKKLLSSKRISKRGEKRATKYFGK